MLTSMCQDLTLTNGCLNEYGNLIHNSAAGIADSLRKSTMKNCINYGSMTCTDTAEYEDMDQKGNVIGRYDAPAGTFGGLAGGVSDSTIESSANKGDITGSLIYAGGLSATSNDITIKNCYNREKTEARQRRKKRKKSLIREIRG